MSSQEGKEGDQVLSAVGTFTNTGANRFMTSDNIQTLANLQT
jgi:hypothetical protein